MEKKMSRTTILFIFFFASVLVSHNLVIPVMCRSFEDQKHYYRHHPHAPSTPSTPRTPSGSHHGYPSPHTTHPSTPHHGSSGNCGSPPPSHVPTRPSPPRGGYYEPPPTTPVTPTPVTPTPVTPTPVTPTPVTPTPVTPTPVTPTPTIPVTPTIPGFPIPPITPIIPGFPIPPSTPFIPDPNSPPPLLPGTCSYWRSHPDAIFALVGFWGSIGNLFGIPSTPSLGLNPSLIQALSDPRTDGIGALYREGTASFLNSIANRRFPFTTEQVRNRFSNGLTSNKAATAQAQVFKLANEGRFKPRA